MGRTNRKTAEEMVTRQLVTNFVNVALLKISVCGSGLGPVMAQIMAYREIAAAMGWKDITGKIDRTLRLDAPHDPSQTQVLGGEHVAEKR